MLKHEEKQTVIEKYHTDRSFDLFDLIDEIERAVLAKAMPIPKQEPVGICKQVTSGEKIALIFPSKALEINHGDKLYAHPQPAQAAAIPDGYAIAPLEPSTEQIDAGVAMALQVSVHGEGGWSKYLRGLYKQMLSASPNPPQSESHQVAQCCEIIRDLSSVIRSQINLGKLKGDDKYVAFGGSRGEISNLLGWADSILSESQKPHEPVPDQHDDAGLLVRPKILIE